MAEFPVETNTVDTFEELDSTLVDSRVEQIQNDELGTVEYTVLAVPSVVEVWQGESSVWKWNYRLYFNRLPVSYKDSTTHEEVPLSLLDSPNLPEGVLVRHYVISNTVVHTVDVAETTYPTP
jgi:hypothetical protein